MNEPDDKFQKTVLWHLADIEVELSRVQHQLAAMWKMLGGDDPEKFKMMFDAETDQMHKIVYRSMLNRAGLEDHDPRLGDS